MNLKRFNPTKAFVKLLSLNLVDELLQRRSIVRILVVCPAPVKDIYFASVSGMSKA